MLTLRLSGPSLTFNRSDMIEETKEARGVEYLWRAQNQLSKAIDTLEDAEVPVRVIDRLTKIQNKISSVVDQLGY